MTLERDDGIVEKRIEKRTLVEEDEDDTDHDKVGFTLDSLTSL